MSQVLTLLKNAWSDQRGSASVEYGLIIALLTLAVMAGVTASGDKLRTKYSDIGFAFEESNSQQIDP